MKSKNLYSYFKESFQKDHESYLEGCKRKTGFAAIDKEMRLHNGLIILGAESGMGKTTFAVDLCVNLIHSGEDVLYFTLEQGGHDFFLKVLSILEAQYDDGKVVNYDVLSFEDIEILVEKHKDFFEHFSYEEANFGMSVHDIIALIEENTTDGTRPIVVIDYLQIIARDNSIGSREGLDSILKTLKQYQNCKSLCMIVISALNRANYGTRISTESFKESGNIEYSADMIWGLQWQILDDPLFDQTGKQNEKKKKIEEELAKDIRKIQFVCLKNRGGKPGFSCNMEFIPDRCLFRSEGLDDPFMKPSKKEEKTEEPKTPELNFEVEL